MQGLQQFSATPATRERTKKTKEAAVKGKVMTTAERLAEEMKELEAQDAGADEQVIEEDDLQNFDETCADTPLTENQKLMRAADEALKEESE